MPRGDRTGPFGQGPMTGRRAGFCAGYERPGYANPAAGRGCWRGGWGAGWGYRRRNRYNATAMPGWARWGWPPAWGPGPWGAAAPPEPSEETDWLKRQAEWLKEQLEAIEKRIAELEERRG